MRKPKINKKMCTVRKNLYKFANGESGAFQHPRISSKVFDNPIMELENIRSDWDKINELNLDNYKAFTNYHYDHIRPDEDKWFKFVIVCDAKTGKYHFWFFI